MTRIKLKKELIKKWINFIFEYKYINQKTYNILMKLIDYELKINGNDVIKDGFNGNALGKEIEMREKKNFIRSEF